MGRRTAIAFVAGLGLLLAIGSAVDGEDLFADDSAAESSVATDPPSNASAPTVRRVTDPGPSAPTRPDVRLDPRCERGRVMCADKTTRTLRWVVDGRVLMTFDARFGGPRTPTREGIFHVYDMLRHHESSLYGTQMPFAMFFSGGQAVHYSPDFAAEGYDGASHGCVNLRDRGGVAELFDRVREGDKVVVYRS